MSYSSTVLNGLIDYIISAVFYFVNWIFHNILSFFLKFVYEATIYVPLVCINAIVIIFRFFCGGFANYIFGDGHQLFDPSTGKIDLSGWSLTSPLGIMVYFSFIVSIIFFFIFFLFTFRGGAKNDAGKPIQGAWMRFASLKWPLFMIMSLYIMPYFFVLADYFMQQLMLFFNNSMAKTFTQDDIDKLVGNFENDFHNFATNVSTASVSGGYISGLQFAGVLGDLQIKCQALIDWNDTTGLTSYWGEALTRLQSDLNFAQNYANSGAIADSQTMANLIGTFQVGGYISPDNLAAIGSVKGDMNQFFNIMTTGFASDSALLNSDVFDNIWKAAGYSIADGGAGVTKDALLAPLNAIVDTWNNGGSNTLHDFKNLANMLANGINADGAYDPSRYICLSDLSNHVAGISNFQMVGIIYSLATGDPNPNNWSDPYGNDFAERADVLRWVTSVFAVWGMILIVYTYVSEAMKRTYYLIGYWIIGFFYLANGMSQTNAAIKWYKQIFFRWFGVILIMICFEMSGILVMAIVPSIQAALNLPIYNFGGSKVLVILGVILAMEAGFQVGYLIYQKFMGEAGTGAENFKYQAPNLLSSGNSLFNSALSNAEYYGTGGPLKDAYNKVNSYKEYWAKKNDAKLKKESTDWSIAERTVKQNAVKKSVNEAGYDVNFAGPHGLGHTHRSGQPYDPDHGQEDPKKPGGGGGGAPAKQKTPRVRVPENFTNYRRSNDAQLDEHVSHWSQGDTIGRRIQNLGRGLLTTVARGGEAIHNAAATIARKTGIAGFVMGAAGIFGGERGVLNAQRALGNSNARVSRAEKEWAKAHGVSIAKSAKTGEVKIYPQGHPKGPGADNSLTGQLGSSQLHNGKLWYNDDSGPRPIAPPPPPAGPGAAPPPPPNIPPPQPRVPNNPPAANPPAPANPPIANPPVANPPIANPPVANPPIANPPVANPPIANAPIANPPVANPVGVPVGVSDEEGIELDDLFDENPIEVPENPISEHENPINEYESPISEHENPINEYESPISEHESPISEHENPISEHESPISEHENPINEYESPISEHESPISEHENPINEHENPLNQFESENSQFDSESFNEHEGENPISEFENPVFNPPRPPRQENDNGEPIAIPENNPSNTISLDNPPEQEFWQGNENYVPLGSEYDEEEQNSSSGLENASNDEVENPPEQEFWQGNENYVPLGSEYDEEEQNSSSGLENAPNNEHDNLVPIEETQGNYPSANSNDEAEFEQENPIPQQPGSFESSAPNSSDDESNENNAQNDFEQIPENPISINETPNNNLPSFGAEEDILSPPPPPSDGFAGDVHNGFEQVPENPISNLPSFGEEEDSSSHSGTLGFGQTPLPPPPPSDEGSAGNNAPKNITRKPGTHGHGAKSRAKVKHSKKNDW